MPSLAFRAALAVRTAFAGVAAMLCAAPLAQAQCPDWQAGFGYHGGNGLGGQVFAATVHDDGNGPALYVSGNLVTAGGLPVRRLARWDGTTWSALGSGANAHVRALVSHDDGSGPALYVGGSFTEIGGVLTRGIARWNGTAWSDVGGGMAGSVWTAIYALASFDDGTGSALYAAGDFTSIGGVSARGIARWNGSAWSGVGTIPEHFVDVRALAVHDDGNGPKLHAGGFIGNFLDDQDGTTNIVRWNGSSWTYVGPSLIHPLNHPFVFALVSHDDGSGRKLYGGGHFTSAGVPGTLNFARWNGTAFESVGGGPNGINPVYVLSVFDEGVGRGPELFVGGQGPGTVGSDGVARWNGSTYSNLSGGLQATFSPIVQALQPFDAGLGAGRTLLVMGDFLTANTSTGPVESSYIAAWSSCRETGRTLCFGDGSGTACPCGNASASADREGCTNSAGIGGRLRATGEPSLSQDTLVLQGSRMRNGSALYFQGTTNTGGGAGSMFGDGLRCAGGTVQRIAVVANSNGASSYPGVGGTPTATQGAVGQPGKRTYQIWYRDAGAYCTASTFNLTNAVEIMWTY